MILLDKENNSALFVGTAYGLKYYGVDDGRENSFCRIRGQNGIL